MQDPSQASLLLNKHDKRSRFLWLKPIFKLGILLFLILLIAWLWGERQLVTVATYQLRLSDLPATFKGMRIVFLTDLHYGKGFGKDELRRVVTMAQELRPDLILLGGDYLGSGVHGYAELLEELSGLKAKEGIYAVMGNHEYTFGGTEALKGLFSRYGLRLLVNDGVWIKRAKARIRLCGLDDIWYGKPSLQAALAEAQPSDVVILVCHNPDFASSLKPGQVDLMFSGHTHGGQITFFGLYAPLLPTATGQKYRSGLVKDRACPVVVSNGLGTIWPYLRFFAPPQIVLVVLE